MKLTKPKIISNPIIRQALYKVARNWWDGVLEVNYNEIRDMRMTLFNAFNTKHGMDMSKDKSLLSLGNFKERARIDYDIIHWNTNRDRNQWVQVFVDDAITTMIRRYNRGQLPQLKSLVILFEHTRLKTISDTDVKGDGYQFIRVERDRRTFHPETMDLQQHHRKSFMLEKS